MIFIKLGFVSLVGSRAVATQDLDQHKFQISENLCCILWG